MNDDWSLKNKKHFDGWYTSYSDKDIETLKQKLIEDFNERLGDECSVCGQSVMTFDEIKDFINKRFGVEDE